MRFTHLFALLPLTGLPLVSAAPHEVVPDLDVKQWHAVQGGLFDSLWGHLPGWSFDRAAKIAQEVVNEPVQLSDKDKTVWEQLKADDQFSKLVKAIEFARAEKYFDTHNYTFTLFAPNNDALKPPHHHDHHHHHHDELLSELQETQSLATAVSILENPSFAALGDHDDDKKKKEFFRVIVKAILEYHSVPHRLTASELAQNSTIATVLRAHDGTFAGLHRRIKVQKKLVPPSLLLNFYAKVSDSDKEASNGIFHVIDAPLIPPPSIFQILYNVPDVFSTATSAVQRLNATEELDFQYDLNFTHPEKITHHGTKLATFFAPSNLAFHKLPPRLKLFLFSPFGERVLAKILAYHYLPETLLLSELLVDQRKDKHHVEYFGDGDEVSFHKEFEIKSALKNGTLHIVVDKTKVLPIEGATKTTIKVNDVTAIEVDAQAINGAFHPLGSVLVPPHKHHDENGVDVAHLDSWENWEEWLPAFAADA